MKSKRETLVNKSELYIVLDAYSAKSLFLLLFLMMRDTIDAFQEQWSDKNIEMKTGRPRHPQIQFQFQYHLPEDYLLRKKTATMWLKKNFLMI